jgi:3D (Asp-Asp-Asp) domain-containing protein
LGADKGRIRLKGLFAFGSAALALGYAVPTVGVASGPATSVAASTPVQHEFHPASFYRPPYLQPREVTRTVTAPLPFGVRQVADGSLNAGTSAVDIAGAAGLTTTVLRDSIEDDAVVDTVTLSVTTAAPVDQLLRIGTHVDPPPRPAAPVQPPGVALDYSQVIQGSATSYCLTGTTATGTQAGPGSIAVDPTVIKLGSHLYVPGYGYGWAVDTGGVIKGTLIDVWYTCDAAIQWGRRPVTIYVLTS